MKLDNQEKKNSMADVLLAAAIALLVLGLAYCAHSLISEVSLTIFGQKVPGFLLGGFVAFLGGKYLLSALKLRKKVRGLA